MRTILPFLLFWALALPAEEYPAFFRTHCIKCHGAEKQKADLRLDKIAAPSAGKSAATWSLIADVIESGEMPPGKEPRPGARQVDRIVDWISGALARIGPPLLGLRRMNGTEYENTVHDLLGTDTPLKDLLPEDNSVQGFDNVATGLGISSILMERYLDAADAGGCP